MAMPVAVRVVMGLGNGWSSIPSYKQKNPKRSHRQPRPNPDPRIQALRQNILRGEKGNAAEDINAGGVGGRDDEAKRDSVLHRASRADKVSCDHGLSMTRLKRVQGAQRHGQRKRRRHDADSQLFRGEQLREGAPRRCLTVGLERQRLNRRAAN
jgi:hypothetical protein